MQNIIIIGGAGFIGSRICNRLSTSNNKSFTVVDKVKSSLFSDNSIEADIRFPDSLNSDLITGVAIINLAAEHHDDVEPLSLYDEVNVEGARHVCDLARVKSINKIIFTSSVAVYGFAPVGINEFGKIAPFNDYGRTKWEAEQVYRQWQSEDSQNRTLVIVRPTVVFGERNRGNVFNLFKQVASSKFVMVGDGLNRKSIAYVENIAAFLEYSLDFKPGLHVFNYVDKPDFTMNDLVAHINTLLGKSAEIKCRIPLVLGVLVGKFFDFVAKIIGKKLPVSAIRVKKFCVNSVYESAVDSTGFIPPVPLMEAIEKTVRYEFIEDHKVEQVFYSE